MTLLGLDKISGHVAQALEVAVHPFDVAVELFRLRGRHQPALDPLEQGKAQLLLRVGQYLADGRLRNAQHLGCPGHRTGGVHGVEYLDVA